MNNPGKVLLGSLVGAGIGVAVAKLMERGQADGLHAAAAFSAGDDPSAESFRARLERAKLAGEQARAATESGLRAAFRDKVRDTGALADRAG